MLPALRSWALPAAAGRLGQAPAACAGRAFRAFATEPDSVADAPADEDGSTTSAADISAEAGVAGASGDAGGGDGGGQGAGGEEAAAGEGDGEEDYPTDVRHLLKDMPHMDPQAPYLTRLQGVLSPDPLYTIAHASGARLTGNEVAHFAAAFNVHQYPPVPDSERLYPEGCLEDMQLEVLRRMNISMPCKKGQRIYGTVVSVSADRVMVDIGHSSLAQLNRKELNLTYLVSASSSDTHRASAHDVRAGDKFVFRIQELKCPLGSIWVVPDTPSSQLLADQVWAEIEQRKLKKEIVQGRILNAMWGGWAVGVAGYVGQLPFRHALASLCGKVGVLQDFFVTGSDAATRSFTLCHAHLAEQIAVGADTRSPMAPRGPGGSGVRDRWSGSGPVGAGSRDGWDTLRPPRPGRGRQGNRDSLRRRSFQGSEARGGAAQGGQESSEQ